MFSIRKGNAPTIRPFSGGMDGLMQPDLDRIAEWARQRIRSGVETPWTYYKLMQLVDAVEGRLDEKPAAPSSPCCGILQTALQSAADAFRTVLEETSLAALVDQARARGSAMYYI